MQSNTPLSFTPLETLCIFRIICYPTIYIPFSMNLKSLLESVTGHPKAWTQTRLLQLATGFGALLHFQARSESSGSLELVFHITRVTTDEIE